MPPESVCPRGAKDSACSGSDWTLRNRVCNWPLVCHWLSQCCGCQCRVGRTEMYPKQAANFLVGGRTLRGPQASRRRGIPRCGPIHVDQIYSIPITFYRRIKQR